MKNYYITIPIKSRKIKAPHPAVRDENNFRFKKITLSLGEGQSQLY